MKSLILYIFLIASVIVLASFYLAPKPSIDKNTPVWEVLELFGEPAPNHVANEQISGASAERGADLTLAGIAKKPSGGKTRKQSSHFVCTSCHNIKKEDPDLRVSDPQARLEFARDNNLPFLQGTSLYGAVNRLSFYNGDYDKKYGKLVEAARNDLREAIQLCAVECAQGRHLKDWELESILRYLWTLELKMGDLNLSETDYQKIRQAADDKKGGKDQAMIDFIKGYYLEGSPASFVKPPDDRKEGYPELVGNPENGELIYDLSCKHCHENNRYSFYLLDDAKTTFRHLKKHFDVYTRYSVYQVARYGTPPIPGKKAYMPQYTMQKMSNQQVEDLRAYVKQRAGGGN